MWRCRWEHAELWCCAPRDVLWVWRWPGDWWTVSAGARGPTGSRRRELNECKNLTFRFSILNSTTVNYKTLGSGSCKVNILIFFISPGFSDLNIAGSATGAAHTVGGPMPHDTPEQPRKDGFHPPTFERQKKRRRGGKALSGYGGGSLDKALASFLSWQQSAEERLLSLEEARMEREFQAEERREQREERRAEQERQHELRLFRMLTGALVAARQRAPAAETQPTDPSFSPPAHLSASLMTTATASLSSSLSQPPSEAPAAQAVSTQETIKSTLPSSAKPRERSLDVLATARCVETPGPSVYLSNRGNSIRQQQGILQEGFAQYGADKYHDTDNPGVSLCHIINTQLSDTRMTLFYIRFSFCFCLPGYNQHGHQWEQIMLWSSS